MIGLIEWCICYNIKVICIKWYSAGRETYIQYRFKDSDVVTYLESSWLHPYISELMAVQQCNDMSTVVESPYVMITLLIAWHWENISPSQDLNWASCCAPNQRCQCNHYVMWSMCGAAMASMATKLLQGMTANLLGSAVGTRRISFRTRIILMI